MKNVDKYYVEKNAKGYIMNLYSTWTGTYSFVFELKTLLKAFKEFLDTVLKKIEYVEARIDG